MSGTGTWPSPSTCHEEAVGSRDLDNVSRLDQHVLSEIASKERIEIGLLQVVYRLGIFLGRRNLMHDKGSRAVGRVESSRNADQLQQRWPAFNVVNTGRSHSALYEVAAGYPAVNQRKLGVGPGTPLECHRTL